MPAPVPHPTRRDCLKTLGAATAGLSLFSATSAAQDSDSDSETETTVTLYAGRDTDIGTVTVEQHDNELHVTYTITNDAYAITSTALHVGDIPTNPGGNPRIGHFDHQSDHDEPVTTHTHVVDVSDLDGTVPIAAHADVQTDTDTEGAWADGERINQRGRGNWATYFTIDLDAADPDTTDADITITIRNIRIITIERD